MKGARQQKGLLPGGRQSHGVRVRIHAPKSRSKKGVERWFPKQTHSFTTLDTRQTPRLRIKGVQRPRRQSGSATWAGVPCDYLTLCLCLSLSHCVPCSLPLPGASACVTPSLSLSLSPSWVPQSLPLPSSLPPSAVGSSSTASLISTSTWPSAAFFFCSSVRL